MASVVGSFIAIKFIELYTKDFIKWDAYKLGLIDENGKKLRDAENSKEAKEFVSWKNLIRKLKIILNKLPLGQFATKLASFASAFWLLKEDLDTQGLEGYKVINTIQEFLTKDIDNTMLTESKLEFGKFTIINEVSPTLVLINEQTKIVGTVFGINIYEVKDLITSEIYFVSSHDIERL